MAEKELKLKVAEAIQDDVNKGIVRIDSALMKEIVARAGDIVEIEGERKTVGIVDRAYPGDIGLNIIRMDGIIRRNSKTGIGEFVKVRKVAVKEAKKVIIAPAKKGIRVQASPTVFKQGLLGRAVVKGDIVGIGGTSRRKMTMSSSPFFDDIFEMLDDNPIGFGFGDLKFIVADTNPKQPVIISESTEISVNPEAVEAIEEELAPEVSYEDVGGLEEEVKKIREMVELPLKHPELFERLGIEPPKGVLLHGSPGTGKTLLAKAVANETNSHFILINGPEIMSKYYGQSEENLRKKFEEAEKNAPSIIFIDEIDAIAAKREEVHGEVERRVVAQLLATMDGLQSRGKVVVIAASNIPNSLDPALRRPGRFDREIEIGVPGKSGRMDILKIHTRNMPLDTNLKSLGISKSKKEVTDLIKQSMPKINFKKISSIIVDSAKTNHEDTKEDTLMEIREEIQKVHKNLPLGLSFHIRRIIAEDLYLSSASKITDGAAEVQEVLQSRIKEMTTDQKIEQIIDDASRQVILMSVINVTHGFVGADLAALAKEAAMIVLRKVLPDLLLNQDEAIPKQVLDKLYITKNDFREALKVVRPSALREVLVEVPNVRWTDIGGLEGVKQEIKEAVEWPLQHPESFKKLGVKPPKGILLYGAPGTGKTMLAKAVARESDANFIPVKGPEMLSKWVGESEKAVRAIFKKARQTAPSIIFFDEIDSIAPRRGAMSDSHVTERVVNQILTEMDGIEDLTDLVIIAATNRPDIIDTALLRPGRFDRIILCPAPDKKARLDIFNVHTKKMPLKNVDLEELSENAEGYTGADIEAICREAAILALRTDIRASEVTMANFEEAMKKVRPSITKEIEKSYEDLGNHFSAARAKQMEEEKPAYMG